ncbi:uncharacterized protein LOC124449046 [Xenia sp. Carnegie-2017]|uniref:uncharacterized protein LOC124449046 n=1 Tax=Xenia sp. Carnegie-2017 TaxID=2897299 RepID=UPI001F04B0B0|nr:uncharacterized protein LOC124449046 [Xenia sp. Carnegie-2017]
METLLKLQRLDLDPNSPSAAKEWKHWLRTFNYFIQECGNKAPNKHRTLINYVSHSVCYYIEDCQDFDSSTEALNNLYIKPPNEIFARHLLATRRQKPGESRTEFLQELKKLSKDCNVRSLTAEQYREELVRDSFFNGLLSPLIRQRLLENRQLDLKTAFDQANALDLAQKNSEAYAPTENSAAFFSTEYGGEDPLPSDNHVKECPARSCVCNNCGKSGHYAKVCQSQAVKGTKTTASIRSASLCSISAACPKSLLQASTKVSVNSTVLTALVESGSSDSYINDKDFQREQKSVVIEFSGKKPELKVPNGVPVCALAAASIEEPSLLRTSLPNVSLSQASRGNSARRTRNLSNKKLTTYSLKE